MMLMVPGGRAGNSRAGRPTARIGRGIPWILVPLLAGWLNGCTDAGDDAAQTTALEQEVQRKTEELRKARERYDRQLTEFTVSVRARHARKLAELETKKAEERAAYTRTIHALQARLDQAERALLQAQRSAAAPPPAPLQEPRPAPPPPSIVTRPATSVPAEFAVRVSGVVGEKAVVGSHPSTRLVETDEEYRDAFGEIKKRQVSEPIDIPEYGYRAHVTLHNPTEAAVAVGLRCGQGEQRTELAPGELRELTLDAAMGAPLVIRANGRIRSFDVSYP